MGNDVSKKAILELVFNDEDAKAELVDLKNKIDAVKASVALQKEAFSKAKAANAEYNAEIAKSKKANADLAGELAKGRVENQNIKNAIDKTRLAIIEANKATKDAKASQVAANGSYDEAQKKLTALGRDIKAAGNGMAANNPIIKAQQAEYKKLSQSLKDFDAELGNHQRKIGEYENALSGLEGILSSLIPNFDKLSGVIKSASQGIGFMTSWTKKASGGITDMAKSGGKANGVFNSFSGFKSFETGANKATQTAGKAESGVVNLGTSAANTSKTVSELGEGSAEAGTAVEGLGEGGSAAAGGLAEAGAASGGLVIAIVAIIAGVVALISYFAKLTPNADALSQRWAYMKGLFRGFMDDIGQGVGFGKLADDMAKTAQEAANLKMALQDLKRAQTVDLVDDAKADAKIAELNLKMRNRRNTVEQEKSYYDQIQSLAENKYKGNKELADKEYELAVRSAVNSQRFSDAEKKRLMQDGIDYAIILDKTKGLINGDEDLKAIAEAQQKQIATSREREMIEERAQNRMDAIDMKAEAAATRAKDKADRLREQAAHDLAEAKRGLDEADNDRRESIARMLSDQKDAFAKELSMSDEHFRQLIFKQQEFIKKQDELAAKTKSPKARAAFKKAAGAGQDDIDQLTKEKGAATLKIIEDNNEKMYQVVIKADLDIKNLRNQSEENELKQKIEAEDLRVAATLDGMQKERETLEKSIRQNTETVKTAKGDELKFIQKTLDQQKILLSANNLSQEAETKASEQRKAKIKRDAAHASLMASDQAKVLANKSRNGNTTSTELAAEKKEITDRYEYDIAEAARAGKSTVLLKQEELSAIKALEDNYRTQQFDKAVKYEKMVQDAATSIISNAISHNAQAAQVNMDKAKTAELKNTALTSTQKEIIEEKYRVKSGQEKVKEFKANQKLQEANALINLMVGEGRLWVDPGFPAAIPLAIELAAQGAAQIATIASQKPPAYATGDIHYTSDGKGSLLRGPGTGKSDSMNARLSNGEAIINARSTSMFKPILSAINTAGGGKAFGYYTQHTPWFAPGFATGGTFNTYSPTADNGLRPTPISQSGPVRLHPDDISSIGNYIGSNFPAVYVDVKDVNNQQDILSQNKARVII